MNLPTLNRLIERTIKKAGIKNNQDPSSPKVMRTNGFRKFAITRMIEADVSYKVREYLVGHKHCRGLEGIHYDKTREESRFEKWAKAISLLTINREYQLTKDIQRIKELDYEHRFRKSGTPSKQSMRSQGQRGIRRTKLLAQPERDSRGKV